MLDLRHLQYLFSRNFFYIWLSRLHHFVLLDSRHHRSLYFGELYVPQCKTKKGLKWIFDMEVLTMAKSVFRSPLKQSSRWIRNLPRLILTITFHADAEGQPVHLGGKEGSRNASHSQITFLSEWGALCTSRLSFAANNRCKPLQISLSWISRIHSFGFPTHAALSPGPFKAGVNRAAVWLLLLFCSQLFIEPAKHNCDVAPSGFSGFLE